MKIVKVITFLIAKNLDRSQFRQICFARPLLTGFLVSTVYLICIYILIFQSDSKCAIYI